MTIGLLAPRHAPGAALDSDLHGLRATLGRLGHDVRTFTDEDPALHVFVAERDHLLIQHVDGGPVAAPPRMRCRQVLRWHADARDNGAGGLAAALAGADEWHLVDTASNLQRLAAAGVPREHLMLLPAFHDVQRLVTTPADSDLLARWQSPAGLWLAAGDLAGEAARFLLEAFALYLDRCDGAARLIALAPAAHGGASRPLGAIAHEMGLAAHVDAVASTDAAFKAALLSADALIVTAAICERTIAIAALMLGLPIVGAAAAAGIAGDAGLLWDEYDAALLAASLEHLRRDPRLRDELRHRGFTRFDQTFSAYALESRLATVLEHFA